MKVEGRNTGGTFMEKSKNIHSWEILSVPLQVIHQKKLSFYDSYVQWETGVKSVEDTWWMQVIKALDGELGTNHSLAGSMVSGNLSTSAMSYERIEKLGTNGIPDIILISAGCNDLGILCPSRRI